MRRVGPPVIFAAVAAIGAAARLSGLVPAGQATLTGHYVGVALGGFGFGLALWSVLTLNRFDGSGPVTDGPFRWSRHPMYLAMLALVAATAAMTGELVIAAAVPVCWLLLDRLVVRPEEDHIRAAFPEAYAEYARRVRRWL